MVEVRFSDSERQILLTMTLHTMAFSNPVNDPAFHKTLLEITRKLEGVDTELWARRRSYWTLPKPEGDTEA